MSSVIGLLWVWAEEQLIEAINRNTPATTFVFKLLFLLVVKSKYTYIIFKTNKNSENHINITKIPSVDQVFEAIELIKELTYCLVLSQTIDNIIATTNTFKQLNLKDIVLKKKFQTIKYNNEKFPGLFIKFDKGTAIIFHSGKIVIVGSKSIEDIECLLENISVNI